MGNMENAVPVLVPAPFVLLMIALEHVLVLVEELVDSDDKGTMVEVNLDLV